VEAKLELRLSFSRWWFASTAFPLIAGTFGPMANAFSICALVQPWREYIPPGSSEAQGDYISDPHWYVNFWLGLLKVT
jgi:potassium channel subfamily K